MRSPFISRFGFRNIQMMFNTVYLLALRYSWTTPWAGPSAPQSLTTAELHLTTFLALPSLSILQSPVHSPSFMLLSTLMRGMPCSMHRAEISFLYWGSSQFSARTQSSACLLSRAFWVSLRPRARPSAIRDCLRTSWRAEFMSMGPASAAAADGTSPSTSLMLKSLMFHELLNTKGLGGKCYIPRFRNAT